MVCWNWFYHFRCVWPGICPNLKKNKFDISLQYLKKEVSDEVDFFMKISMNVCYKLILWFWWEWSSIPKVPKIASLQRLYKLDEVDCLHADKH